MKKFKLFFFAILIIGLLSACDDEDRSFTIDQVKIDAQIEEDGVIEVRELYTYTFDGVFEGMTRSIHSDMKGFEAYETHETNPNAETAEMEKLKVEEDDDDDQLLKIFTDSEDETKSVLYSYEVHGSIDKYADVTDLTYAFFDESNETDLNNVEIKVHLPDKASQKDFHVFLHSDVRGELVQTEDTVQYLAQVLKEGETSEMRLVYPAEQMAQMDVTKNKEKESDILAAERELASKREHLDEKMSDITPLILATGVIIIVAGVGLLIVHPNRYRGDKSPDHLLRLVEATDPMLINYLDKSEYLDHESFIAGLFSLKQRGIITLEEVPSIHQEEADKEKTDKRKSEEIDTKTTLRFTLVDDQANIDQADDYLIEWLFADEDKRGRYFLLESVIAQEEESDTVKEEKAEIFEKHRAQWADLVGKRQAYQGLRSPFNGYGILSGLIALTTFGFIYYFTKVDLLTSTEQAFFPIVLGLVTLSVIFFNKNKWVISVYYLASLIVSLLLFSLTDGLLWLVALLIISWLILMIVPAHVWRDDIKKLKKAINIAYHEFKTKRYPIGTDPKKVEHRLEYAIILGAGKEYGEECGKKADVEQWDMSMTRAYPLLNNPMGTTMMFDPTFLILYSSVGGSSSSFSGSSSTSSTGGGGAGAF